MDFYSKLELHGYRSYLTKQDFCPSSPAANQTDDARGGYNVIVGPNNSGKSSLLHLLSALRWTSLDDDDISTIDAGIKISTTEGRGVDIQYRTESGVRLNISPTDGNVHPNMNVLFINSLRDVSFDSGETPTSFGRSGGPENIKQNLLTTLRGITQHQLDSGVINLVDILGLLQEANLGESYCDFVRDFIPDFGRYRMRVRKGHEYIEYRNSSGDVVSPSFLSDGTKAILILTGLAYYFRIEGNPNTNPLPSVVVLDEPERSLQPDVQRRLHRLLIEISKNVQVIVSTHSPYFVSWTDLLKGATIHRVYKDAAGQSQITRLGYDELVANKSIRSALSSSRQPRRLYHYDPLSREALFSSACLIVEGQDDALILRNFIEENSLAFKYDIFGYGADGANSVSGWVEILKTLGISVAVLLDGDEKGTTEAKKLQSKLPHSHIRQISTEDIRDKTKYEQSPRVGIADERGVIKAAERERLVELLKEINTNMAR